MIRNWKNCSANTAAGNDSSQFLIDPASTEGAGSGLTQPSAAKCENIATVPQADVIDVVGRLSDSLKNKLEESLKAALELV